MVEVSLLESTSWTLRTRTRWYFLVTMTAYSLALSAFIAGGIMLVDPELKESLPMRPLLSALPPPPSLGGGQPAQPAGGLRAIIVTKGFQIPTKILSSMTPRVGAMPEVGEMAGLERGAPWGRSGGQPGGVDGGLPYSIAPDELPAPPRQPGEAMTSPATPRVSGGVLPGNAIRRVRPVYPARARGARASGQVHVEVVIDESGNVISASVVRGHWLLRQAALEAARQWKFRPTLLNGAPIEVTGVLIFNFTL